MKISLVGFMGTGKSSVGELLARRLNLEFVETDNIIEERTGKAIPEIFAREGEDYFRWLESEVLNEIIGFLDDFVIATGGGIVISPENRTLLQENTYSILLEAAPAEIYERTKADGERPLLAVEDPCQKIEDLLAERSEYYGEFSRKVKTDGKSPVQVADEILNMMEDDNYETGK